MGAVLTLRLVAGCTRWKIEKRKENEINITIIPADTVITARISGPITENDGEPLKKAFSELLSASQKYVELDLSRVPIITSTGIGKLILLFRKLKDQARELKIKAINDNLYDMFASINLDRMLKIERN